MMPADRFEQHLPESLTELGQPRTPDYFDDLLRQTAHTRQRPAWTFVGRWIPVLAVGRRPMRVWNVPWRPLLILGLLALLLAATLAFFVGTRHRPAPPFGLARNGLIAYASEGDIYAGDPATGVARLILAGPDNDEFPTWSLDGTEFAFIRQSGTTDGGVDGRMFVADADGGNLAPLIPGAVTATSGFEFSPDGGFVVFSSTVGPGPAITIASTRGAAPRILPMQGLPASLVPDGPSYRPYHESEIMFAAWGYTGSNPYTSGIYVIGDDGTNLRELVKPTDGVLLYHPTWSPDGLRVAYTRVPVGSPGLWELHVLTIDGLVDRAIHTSDAQSEGWPVWSPDGLRLLIQRTSEDGSGHVYAVVPSDGTGPGIEIRNDGAPIGANCAWSPDGTSILAIPDGDGPKLLMWDALTGATRTLPWTAGNFWWTGRFPAWQRLAP